MRVVVLGGTGFLSSAVVDAALAAGSDVVAVTRGRRGDPPTGVQAVVADRDDAGSLRAGIASLDPPLGADDVVVDVCGYTVEGAHAAASVLGAAGRYAYVSSISAYRDWPPGPIRGEDDPTFPPDADLDEYGPMKAESERVLRRGVGEHVLLVRAGLIIGPGDRTRRLTSWLHRIATQDRVVVPAELDQPMAFVDARDLAAWMLRALDAGASGPVNAVGPVGMTTTRGLLQACRSAVAELGGTPAELVPVPEAELLAAGVEVWRDLPFWMPAETARTAWDVDTTRAQELGLVCRPVEESVRDAWAWVREVGLDHEPPTPTLQRLARG